MIKRKASVVPLSGTTVPSSKPITSPLISNLIKASPELRESIKTSIGISTPV